MTDDAARIARIARIDATFADEDLRIEAYAVLAREDGCTTCVECCYPRATVSPPPTLPFRAPS